MVFGLVHQIKNSTPSTTVSSNWAGFVVGNAGSFVSSTSKLSFTKVSGSWIAPTAACTAGSASYSAFWVGLGGADPSSQALEQTGTGADCSASGTPTYYAWYEVVPAPSKTVKLKVFPGDTISASVAVSGKKVTVLIRNVTRGTKFTKILKVAKPDRSSAEWIAEAPSACTSNNFCRTLPLANFGTVSFSKSLASVKGHTGSISDARWPTTSIELQSDGGTFSGGGHHFAPTIQSGSATPSDLSPDGTSFSVAWQAPTQTPPPTQPSPGPSPPSPEPPTP